MGRGTGRLSDAWFDQNRVTSVRLFWWQCLLLGLSVVPLLGKWSAVALIAWYGPLLLGFLGLGVWLGVRIVRSIRLGRADLRSPDETVGDDTDAHVGSDMV